MWKIGSWFGNSTVPPTGTTATLGSKALPFMVTVALDGRGFTFGPSTHTTASATSEAFFPPFSTTATRPRTVPAGAGTANARHRTTSHLHPARIFPLVLRGLRQSSKAAARPPTRRGAMIAAPDERARYGPADD